jgi:hypothetical protein
MAKAAGGSWGMRHAIAEEQTKRERKEQAERLRAELTLAGVRIVPRPRDWGYRSREVEASTLLDREGQPVDPEQVKARPGFAAFIDTQSFDGDPRAVIICLDPEEWGYTRTQRTSYVPDTEKAAAAEAERQVAARRVALQTAAGVRRAFLAQLYGNARAAKKVYLDALRAVLLDPGALDVPQSYTDLADSLAGASFETVETAGVDRLTRMLVARWLTSCEAALDSLIVGRWNRRPAAGRSYLDRLIAAGYALSEAEQTFYDELVAELLTDDEEDDEDQDDGDEDVSDEITEVDRDDEVVDSPTEDTEDGTAAGDASAGQEPQQSTGREHEEENSASDADVELAATV